MPKIWPHSQSMPWSNNPATAKRRKKRFQTGSTSNNLKGLNILCEPGPSAQPIKESSGCSQGSFCRRPRNIERYESKNLIKGRGTSTSTLCYESTSRKGARTTRKRRHHNTRIVLRMGGTHSTICEIRRL